MSRQLARRDRARLQCGSFSGPDDSRDPSIGCRLTAFPAANGCRRVVVLGSTGSIGTNCLDGLAPLPGRLRAVGLSAHASWEALFEQAGRFRPRWVAVTDPELSGRLDAGRLPPGTRLLGPDGVAAMAADPEVD